MTHETGKCPVCGSYLLGCTLAEHQAGNCPRMIEFLKAVQPPATPQEPDLREDIHRQNAEIQRLGNAVRDGSATPDMAYAWLTHPYVCTSDMVKAAARIMASAPPAVWKDIETAPKDENCVLLFADGWGVHPGWWDSEHGWLACETQNLTGGKFSEATHWMPLPSPPTPGGK